eukprot:1070083-Heterocapsa_arctica.AAC.1
MIGSAHGYAGYSRKGPRTVLRILGSRWLQLIVENGCSPKWTLVRDHDSTMRFENLVDHVHVTKEGHIAAEHFVADGIADRK